MTSLNVIQKEAKILKFTIKDDNGDIINLTGATFAFYLKSNFNANPTVTKSDSYFNKSNAVNGIIKLPLSSSDLNLSGTYYGLLKTILDINNIDKYYFEMIITASGE